MLFVSVPDTAPFSSITAVFTSFVRTFARNWVYVSCVPEELPTGKNRRNNERRSPITTAQFHQDGRGGGAGPRCF